MTLSRPTDHQPCGARAWLTALLDAPDRDQAVDRFCDEEPWGVQDVVQWALEVFERNHRTAQMVARKLGDPDLTLVSESYLRGLATGVDPHGWTVPLPAAPTRQEGDPF